MDAKYAELSKGETWWCNIHQRHATHIFRNKVCCDPTLGGIMLPCRCVNITGIATISRDSYTAARVESRT